MVQLNAAVIRRKTTFSKKKKGTRFRSGLSPHAPDEIRARTIHHRHPFERSSGCCVVVVVAVSFTLFRLALSVYLSTKDAVAGLAVRITSCGIIWSCSRRRLPRLQKARTRTIPPLPAPQALSFAQLLQPVRWLRTKLTTAAAPPPRHYGPRRRATAAMPRRCRLYRRRRRPSCWTTTATAPPDQLTTFSRRRTAASAW